jgi:hypothetical protein
MNKIVCPLCKGKGDRLKLENWLLAPFTAGISLLCPHVCNLCEGDGYLKTESIHFYEEEDRKTN